MHDKTRQQMRFNCEVKTSETMCRGGRRKMETISRMDRPDDGQKHFSGRETSVGDENNEWPNDVRPSVR